MSVKQLFHFLEERGFIDNITSKTLKEGEGFPLKGYVGFDPTSDSLHLGNLVGIIAAAWLHRFGHTPVILLGGGTAKIGDPSGKSVERPLLDSEKLEKNIEAIKKQIQHLFSSLEGKRSPFFVNNDKWLSRYPLISFLRDVGKVFRLGPMLGKESVRSRLESKEGMSFTEFSYQMLQAYDFYHLFQKEGVLLQIGGSDQWGNITAGVELIRKLTGKTVFGLTHPLLVRSDGMKFGKSEEGAIWLDPKKTSPYQFYQYLVQVSDADVIQLMRMLTFMDMEEISSFEQALKANDFVPYEAQKRLAQEVTRFVHGEEKLALALRVTEAIAPGSEAKLDPEVLREVAHAVPFAPLPIDGVITSTYVELAVKGGLVQSKGEATRLIRNGGAYLNNRRVENSSLVVQKSDLIGGKYLLLGSGKKKKLLIEVVQKGSLFENQ